MRCGSFPPRDEASLTRRLAWAASPDGFDSRHAAAADLSREVLLARYDWADIAARTEAVYEDVLRRRHRRPADGDATPSI